MGVQFETHLGVFFFKFLSLISFDFEVLSFLFLNLRTRFPVTYLVKIILYTVKGPHFLCVTDLPVKKVHEMHCNLDLQGVIVTEGIEVFN